MRLVFKRYKIADIAWCVDDHDYEGHSFYWLFEIKELLRWHLTK